MLIDKVFVRLNINFNDIIKIITYGVINDLNN